MLPMPNGSLSTLKKKKKKLMQYTFLFHILANILIFIQVLTEPHNFKLEQKKPYDFKYFTNAEKHIKNWLLELQWYQDLPFKKGKIQY